MKKLLSIMLVLLMALSVFACAKTPAEPEKPAEQPTAAPVEQPTEAPAEPTVEPTEPAVAYEGIGLQLKNKTGPSPSLPIYMPGRWRMCSRGDNVINFS